MPNIALIRGLGGEPLRRVVVGWGNEVIFMSSQRPAASNYEGFPLPIGGPFQDVFIYSESTYESLRAKWQRGAEIGVEEWGIANPATASLKIGH
jgi:hypothetical protein